MIAHCLAGFRVLDLSQYLPGPYAGQILADLGAEVVKIEPPAGDPFRQMPPLDGDGLSAFYKLINAGKTVVRLDLKDAAGKAAFLDLVDRADGLIESYRPGALARLGLASATGPPTPPPIASHASSSLHAAPQTAASILIPPSRTAWTTANYSTR